MTRSTPPLASNHTALVPVTTRLILTLCAIGALAAACGPRSHTPDATTAAPAKVTTSALPIGATMDVDVAADVRFALHIRNNSGKKVELVFPNGQTHDITVVNDAGREVWRWSADRMFTQALQTKLLTHGETLSYEERWENPPAGHYTVIGRLNSASHPVERRAEFTVAAK